MSRYRDDTQETCVASDMVISKLTSVVEDSAKIASSLIFGLLVTVTDSAIASDVVIDRSLHLVKESALVSDLVIDSAHSSGLIVEKAKASSKVLGRLRVITNEAAVITDLVLDKYKVVTTDSARITDEVITQRRALSIVEESAKATDLIINKRFDLVHDNAALTENYTGKLRAKNIIVDAAVAQDFVIDAHINRQIIVDSAKVSDFAYGTLHAKDLVQDTAVVEDYAVFTGDYVSQAWTANTDNWSMSRYMPYTFTHLTVINGIAYGANENGVYALSGGVEDISSSITTGKIDIGGGSLVHPISAYLEYELDGTAELDVTTTQSGTKQAHTYQLAQEVADELTNGRFIFGRGLRGRHFSFTLRMQGKRGYINDLSVHSTQTKRRV